MPEPKIILTTEQQLAVDSACACLKTEEPLYRIGGYAGTGKTTVAKFITKDNSGCMPCAFTGKAALRLREKGLHDSRTIHSIIYEYNQEEEIFELRDDVDGDWFLIDEGSMISTILWCDIQTFNKPIIVLGDPGQLEPVGDDPNLMKEPDIVLQEIQRQAKESSIIQFATDIRLGLNYFNNIYKQEEVELFKKERFPLVEDLLWADIIICGYNRTRNNINLKIRNSKEHKGLLCKGERIIILQNNRNKGVFNGQLLTVDTFNVMKTISKVKCIDDFGESYNLTLVNAQFGAGKNIQHKEIKDLIDRKEVGYHWKDLQNLVLADYGYAITCHKSQGSEWNKVVVIDEQCPKLWEASRWRYTAITRAAKQLKFFFK